MTFAADPVLNMNNQLVKMTFAADPVININNRTLSYCSASYLCIKQLYLGDT